MVDGDKSLVVANETIINAAERIIKKYNIVPLYYEMSKAPASIINNEELFQGLILAYTGGNIGMISNAITKIWNSGEITEEKIKTVKLLCLQNNFVID